MKKTFLVSVEAYRDVIVEAEDEESAMDIAREEVHSFDWEIENFRIEDELKTDRAIKNAKSGGATDVYDV